MTISDTNSTAAVLLIYRTIDASCSWSPCHHHHGLHDCHHHHDDTTLLIFTEKLHFFWLWISEVRGTAGGDAGDGRRWQAFAGGERRCPNDPGLTS